MTPNQQGFLQFHNLVNWLVKQELTSKEGADEVKRLILTESGISKKIAALLLTLIDTLEQNGLDE